jgi:lipopolysaccharide transport system ATP-binding protein
MRPPVITLENLGKCYSLGARKNANEGLRHSLEAAIRTPRGWLRSQRQKKFHTKDFWALRNVSLEIGQGDVVGIIGRNGAGKSTLLKLLSRITVPTEGKISIDGRIASLLEVGTGFHQELTGRENIFLNGAILGMRRAEIIRKFDQIVEFSGVEEFLDTPVKRYSSGMFVRLAFAVAAHLEPDILIVDEVLAVGDATFQKKCLGKMGDFAQSGRTVLFVSHNAEAVRRLCRRCIWLKDGSVHRDGEAEEVLEDYFHETANDSPFSFTIANYGLAIHDIVLKNSLGDKTNQFRPGEDLVVEVSYYAEQPLITPYVVMGVQGINGSCFTANMLLDGNQPRILAGAGKLACRFKSLPLFPQSYTVKMSIRMSNGHDMILNYQDVASFSVVGDLAEYGYKGEFLSRVSGSTSVVVPYEWSLPDGTNASVSLALPEKLAAV